MLRINNRYYIYVWLIVGLMIGVMLIDQMARILANYWWFQERGYVEVWFKRLWGQTGLFISSISLTSLIILVNLWLTKLSKDMLHYPRIKDNKISGMLPGHLSLWWLLLWTLLLTGTIAVVVTQLWEIDQLLWSNFISNNHYNLLLFDRLISPLEFNLFWHHLPSLFPFILIWFLIFLGITTARSLSLIILTVFITVSFTGLWTSTWAEIFIAFVPSKFQNYDPLFGQNLSFYIFHLPIIQLAIFWLSEITLFTISAVSLIYILRGNTLSNGYFWGFQRKQLQHLSLIGAFLSWLIAANYIYDRYQLLYSPRGVTYGASVTDIDIQLPADQIMVIVSLIMGLILLIYTTLPATIQRRSRNQWSKLPAIIIIYLSLNIILNLILTNIYQKVIVQPNELELEKPYIERSIESTRKAFALSRIDSETFDPTGDLTPADIDKNNLTIKNIRLWDSYPLLKTNRQLQQIRPYYKFIDADIDRYRINGQQQQVILSPRELDYNNIPNVAKTWVNERLVYTHGYGFTMSPVNTIATGGLPEYFIKDLGEDGKLTTKNPQIRQDIPIDQPRIYFGEVTNNYIFTPSLVQELDYPIANNNVYNTYDGRGGIKINNWWRKLIFAIYLKDPQVLFTNNFTAETKVLWRRQINERVQAIAPWFKYDRDPYLVIADTDRPHHLYWIIDGYTISSRYPYAEPVSEKFNYIRNSIKVVIDAYHGDVKFYISDPQDPIIQTWSKIFPNLFHSLGEMHPQIKSHLRYPQDLFQVQSERLATYHMTDPQIFYNREDLWQTPTEIYGDKRRPVEPYYLITKLSQAQREEFILLTPFTPNKRTNLIAWLAARVDGEQYGRLLLYQFPKQQLIYGPEQIEALINQDPVISGQIALWNRQGSKVIQGNLLVIPLEKSLLYVEPIYLEAEQNSLPTLVRVIVAYQNQIIMAQNLSEAINGIFSPPKPTSPLIIRTFPDN